MAEETPNPSDGPPAALPAPSGLPDAPDKEKMDQIRRRRMEKLSGRTSTPTDNLATASSSTAAIPASTPGIENQPSVASTSPVSAPQSNPFAKLIEQTATAATKSSINIKPADVSIKRTREDSEFRSAAPPSRRAVESKEETIEEFEHKALASIFRWTLDQNKTTDHNGHRLMYLPGLKQELEEGSAPLMFTAATLDTALMEAVAKIPHQKSPLEYLLPCWKRLLKAQKALKGYTNQKDAILKEARRLCMSNCIFAVTIPELFGRDRSLFTDSLDLTYSMVPYLLKNPDDDHGIDMEFLKDAVARFEEDESVQPMFTKAMAGLSHQLSLLDMNGDFKPFVDALKRFSRFQPLLTAIASDPLFQMATSAPSIETMTILGPFFRISPLQPNVAKTFFSGPKTMDQGRVTGSQNALRMTLATHQNDLKEIIQAFVRAGDVSRNRVLDWFAHIVNVNHKRRAMRVDERAVSSDGFMMNVTVVLDFLCEPFMDSTFSKVGKIDVDYLRRNPRVDVKDETKINADQKSSDQFYETTVAGTSNFISEVFFLTLAAHHYGSESTNSKMKNLEKDIKHFIKTIADMEVERPKFQNNPTQLAQLELAVKKYNDVLEKAMSLKYAIEGVLFDEPMQARSLSFMRYVIVWLLRLATSTDYIPGKVISLPLPAEQPEVFKHLPEYVLEDIVSNFKFIYRFIPSIIVSTQTDELVALCITFLRNSEWIKNPGLKAGLVTLLYHGTMGRYRNTKGVLTDVLFGSKFANDHLLHSLMQFYIECENTGSHTQFYDKFNIRYEIFQIIKVIWPNTIYRQRLTQESKINTEFFIRFVNLLLNDCTYVLDEALDKFPKIHDLQAELDLPGLTEEEKAAKSELLATAESQAKNYMQLTNETMEMMKLFTSALSDAFTMPEIVQRLADMLDYNLATLVGPKSSGLMVRDRAKYDFHPRALLAVFVDIYLNLGGHQRFVEAVAKDGRSYKPENFDSAMRILKNLSLKSNEELETWQSLMERIQAQKELDAKVEEDLGEIPDDFLDPLMADLMEDPVILPKSRMTVDRSTIRSHLLSDPTDPFNRQPMTIEDVIPDLDMIERISKWKEERKAAVKQEMADKMDLSSG